MKDKDDNGEGDGIWEVKSTKEGFIYFHMIGTSTYQWNFPKYFDPHIAKWIKKYDKKGDKYWQHSLTGHIQYVKPDNQTYLIQSAILGNLAFLELYIKCRGSLLLTDQQKRNSLHHAVANGHKQFAILLCEFGALDGLIEMEDQTGCTPLFLAVKYNEEDCLKILIQYNANMFHKKKNGDTCLHEAASFNAWNCMVIISSFVGSELFQMRNREGLRAIEIAEKLKNFECYQTLLKIQRNLGFQSALVEREINHLSSNTQKHNQMSKNKVAIEPSPMSSRTNNYIPEYLQVIKQQDQQKHQKSSRRSKKRLNVIQEQSSESQEDFQQQNQNSSNSEEDINSQEGIVQLGGRHQYAEKLQDYQRKTVADLHEKGYLRKVKEEKQMASKKRKQEQKKQIPKFNEYSKQIELEDKIKRLKKKNRNKIAPLKDDKSLILRKKIYVNDQEDDDDINNDRGNGNSIMSKQYESQSSESEDRNKQQEQKSRSFFKLSIRDDNTLIHNKNPLSKRQLESSRTHRNPHHQLDSGDEENQMGRAKDRNKSLTDRNHQERRRRNDESRDGFLGKAYSTTSNILQSVVYFVRDKYDKIKDYVWQDKDNQDDDSDSNYQTAHSRARSKSRRSKSNKRVVPYNQEESPISTDNKNMYISQKHKPNNKKQKIYPYQVASNQGYTSRMQNNNENILKNIDESEVLPQKYPEAILPLEKPKVSASIQTFDNSPHKHQQLPPNPIALIKQPSMQSTKSIGVGSQCANDSFQTHSSNGALSQNKTQQSNRMLSQKDIKKKMNITRQMTKKNYQSSEDERKRQEKDQRQRNVYSPSPEPRFMKEEIDYLKQVELHKEPEEISKVLPKQESMTTKEQNQQLFTPYQRQLVKSSGQAVQGCTSNQRYGRQPSNSQSSETKQLEMQQHDMKMQIPTSTNTQSTNNPYANSPSNKNEKSFPIQLLNQQQYELLMVNSQEEHEGQAQQKKGVLNHNSNNLYQLPVEELKKNTKPISLQQQDIHKFYDDLLKNTSITQLNDNSNEYINQQQTDQVNNQNAQKQSESIDETNLSELYQRVMNVQIKGLESEQIKEPPPQFEQHDSLIFNPPNNESIDKSLNQFYEQEQSSIIHSLLMEFEDFQNISDLSFIKSSSNNPIPNQQALSNILDKGQFVQTSCASIYNQQQNVSMQRPFGGLVKNNSMLQLNVQYQSDNECEVINNKNKNRYNIFANIDMGNVPESPLKRKPLIPPPMLQKSQVGGTNLRVSENEIQNDNNKKQQEVKITDQQQMYMNLFNEDAKYEQEKEVQIEKQQNLQEELSSNNLKCEEMKLDGFNMSQTNFEIVIDDEQHTLFVDQNKLADDSPSNNNFNPVQTQTVSNMIQYQELEQQLEVMMKSDGPVGLIQSNDSVNNYMRKGKKKQSTRYDDLEDSLINFDISQSKIECLELPQTFLDQTSSEIQIATNNNQIKHDEKKAEINIIETNKIEMVKQTISKKVEEKKNQNKVQSEVLPLQVLKPAYTENDIQRIQLNYQSWEGETHSLIDQTQLAKMLLGNMMAAAFSNSESASSINLTVKRSFLQYQGERATTINQLMDAPAASSANKDINELDKVTQDQMIKADKNMKVRKSQSNLNQSSQDSILQDLDSISRIYNDLETVQEEDIEKTNTLESRHLNLISIVDEESKHSINLGSMKQIFTEKDYQSIRNCELEENKQQMVDDVSPFKIGKQLRNIPKVNQSLHQSQLVSISEGREKEQPDNMIPNLFYRSINNGLQDEGNDKKNDLYKEEQEDNISQIAPNYSHYQKQDNYNRMATSAYLYSMQTSSDDEQKKKNQFLKSRPNSRFQKSQLHSSVNAPMVHQNSSMVGSIVEQSKKKQIKDISFKSSNMSTHTNSSDRLKENLALMKNNKLGLQRKRSSRDNSQNSHNQNAEAMSTGMNK